MRRLLYPAIAVAGGVLLLLLLTVLFIPAEAVRGVVVRALAKEGYTLRMESFGKALPLGFTARSLEISGSKGAVVRADEATVRLKLLPLLVANVNIALTGRIGSGRITGDYALSSGGSTHVGIDRVRLEDIPFFMTVAGTQAKGELRAKGGVTGLRKNPRGSLQLEIRAAEFTGVKIGPTPLPDAVYPIVQGKLVIGGGKATLESFTLQGEGLYARLKGDMPLVTPLSSAPLNVTLELMPKPAFLEKQKWVFLLLTKYLDTPGHYQIPVRGTLGRPAVF